MFRKLFLVALFIGAYFWVVSTDDKAFVAKAKTLYYSSLKTMKENDIKLHVHSLKCFKEHGKKKQKS